MLYVFQEQLMITRNSNGGPQNDPAPCSITNDYPLFLSETAARQSVRYTYRVTWNVCVNKCPNSCNANFFLGIRYPMGMLSSRRW
jgi:hypothetical protein